MKDLYPLCKKCSFFADLERSCRSVNSANEWRDMSLRGAQNYIRSYRSEQSEQEELSDHNTVEISDPGSVLYTLGSDLSNIHSSKSLIYPTKDWGTKRAAYYCMDTFLSDV